MRLVPRITRENRKVHFAFGDFQSERQAELVINTLQGYRFHRDDIVGLQFSYAVKENGRKRRRH